jgi:hypothetical protein
MAVCATLLTHVKNIFSIYWSRSRGGSVIKSVWLRTGRPGFDLRQRQRIFLLASASRPALGPTQSPVQWIPGVLSPGVKRGRGVTLTTHPHLVPRLSMSRSYTSSHLKRLNGMKRDSFTFFYCIPRKCSEFLYLSSGHHDTVRPLQSRILRWDRCFMCLPFNCRNLRSSVEDCIFFDAVDE